jgi:hypothetical protein
MLSIRVGWKGTFFEIAPLPMIFVKFDLFLSKIHDKNSKFHSLHSFLPSNSKWIKPFLDQLIFVIIYYIHRHKWWSISHQFMINMWQNTTKMLINTINNINMDHIFHENNNTKKKTSYFLSQSCHKWTCYLPDANTALQRMP